MTREEAITVLKAFMENPLFSDVHKQAFNIAIHDIKQRHDWDINKLMLVPKTEWEQEPTTKNDLGVDCISRFEVTEIINAEWDKDSMLDRIDALPSVTPQEPIIDKIRAEIEQWHKEGTNWSDVRLMKIEDIIDKYKAESER